MSKKPRPDAPPGAFRRVLFELDADMHERLLAHAQRRTKTISDLVAEIIENAITADLVQDILGETDATGEAVE